MVFHYTIRGGPCRNEHSHIMLESSDITCYVGRDKHENEFLIKYGWPGDIWFHVDSLSSAHVYFRVTSDKAPPEGIPMDNIPEDSVYDMMQIVKNNSISGSKLASCKIVYTPHSNLKKTFDMESGTVTYHDTKLCRYKRCDKDRPRIKELEKTKIERLNVNYYEEMKANERRIVEQKRRLRKIQAAGGNKKNNDAELYDPIEADLRAARQRAGRQGDEQSGIDMGVAALDGLIFSDKPHPMTSSGDAHDDDDGELADNLGEADDDPTWMKEANTRLLETSESIRFLRARGYTMDDATQVLDTSVSPTDALRKLWYTKGGQEAVPNNNNNNNGNTEIPPEVIEARQEEREVLQAIFGEDDGVQFLEDETLFDVVLPITSYEPPERYGLPPPLQLEVYVDNGVAPLYPNEPAVLALVGGGLPEALLQTLTSRLRTEAYHRAKEEPGDPQIFNLVGFVGEEVVGIIEEETAALEVERKRKKEEERLALQAKRQAEAHQKREEDAQNDPSLGLHFKTDAERRAYAKDMVSNMGSSVAAGNLAAGPSSKKATAAQRYDTGVSDQKLIEDLFG